MLEVSAPSKVCAKCSGRFPADALFCPSDGTPLQSAAAAEREASDPYVGQELSGHIEIRHLVGVGAMGRVYRAFQRGIDRDVAVKILHRELSANAQLVTRFTREAKVASRLQHPNVVQVLLTGQLDDRALYMVMEYLDGMSLQSALAAAGGAMPLPRALHIALQLCEAVGEAHAQGIVHRDLKPENVMLVRRGADTDFVKVLDFGIARINWGEQSVATAAGLIFGTARYISPEGAQGNTVNPASDVYAIATLLYQMLAGRTPFEGDQAVGLLVQQIHDPPPPLRSIHRAAYVPEPIADVVMAGLSKDPAKREPDARAFGQAIFDAARLAGLAPEDFARPSTKREPAAMKLPPVERTKQHDLTPDIVERMTPKANGVDPGDRKPTAATVKWEPPTEFQTRLADATKRSAAEAERSRARLSSTVDATMDDLGPSVPHFPTVPQEVPRTLPGEVETPVRTNYAAPSPEIARPPSSSELLAPIPTPAPSRADAFGPRPSAPPEPAPAEPRRSRAIALVFVCFVIGALVAFGWAWKAGRIGGSEGDEERFVTRATDAMFRNHFAEPPGENVKEITDEGLRRWPNDRRLIDVRIRSAAELTSQALAQRSAGDVLEALRLAKLAHELDSNDASAKRLVEQYESELAAFSPSAAPTLVKPPEPRPLPPSTSSAAPRPTTSSALRVDYKALVDVTNATPTLGQTVDITARIAPNKGEFEAPGFVITGPGIPGGVRMAAQTLSPGVFKASYAFLEGGRYDITFTTTEGGRPINAKRTIVAGAPDKPAPLPTPAPPAPTPSGSVKWM